MRYVSSMKKKTSLQKVITQAKKHPYQRPVFHSNTSNTLNEQAIAQSSSSNKVIE